MKENFAPGVIVVYFTITDGDRSITASELGDIQLIGSDGEFFTAEITSSTSGRIMTKYVASICKATCNEIW